jgi:hypothetical protein
VKVTLIGRVQAATPRHAAVTVLDGDGRPMKSAHGGFDHFR